LIAFAMGEAGKMTRLQALVLGAPFSYAALSDRHLTAPGQFSATEMETMYHSLRLQRLNS
jgi:3-dehydroquinate dehydratase-1